MPSQVLADLFQGRLVYFFNCNLQQKAEMECMAASLGAKITANHVSVAKCSTFHKESLFVLMISAHAYLDPIITQGQRLSAAQELIPARLPACCFNFAEQ